MAQQKFFIVGCPRSGTTMLQQALNRHSQVTIPPETAFFSFLGFSRRVQKQHLQRLNEDLEIGLALPEHRISQPDEARTLFEELARQYIASRGKASVTHFGEKTPEHLSRLDRISAVYPEAKILLLYRDGRDVALSLRRLPWTSRDLYVNFALWLHCYRLQQRAQANPTLPILPVCYEDLVQNPAGQLHRVLEFLGLPFEGQVVDGAGNFAGIPQWEYDWKARATEKINSSRLGLWRKELTGEQLGILERWGGWALQGLNYELLTDGKYPLPWFFHLRVACKSLWWLASRPRYALAKSLWLKQQEEIPDRSQARSASPAEHPSGNNATDEVPASAVDVPLGSRQQP